MTPWARYHGHSQEDRATVTLNPHWRGPVLYVWTLGDAALYDTIVAWRIDASAVPASSRHLTESKPCNT